jgi:NADPH-dependent 2,4-dienoyl-CoA reductase/sulfur reductase-like enzyme
MAARTVLIVGAGPAGTRAAERVAAAGLRAVVVDEAAASGGQIYRRQPAHFTRPPEALYGFEAAKAGAIHAAFATLDARIDYRPQTLVWHLWKGEAHLLAGNQTSLIAYDALILATGATDRILPVPGWTLPGVFSLGGAQIALKAQACAIGSRVVFMGSGPLLTLVAYQYVKAGAEVAAVLDTSTLADGIRALPALAARPAMLAKGLFYTAELIRRGVKVLRGVTPVAIEGDDGVSAVRVRDSGGREQVITGDAVGLGHGLRSETQLADLARCDFAFDDIARQWLPITDRDGRTSVPGVYLAGDGARILGADAAELAGRLAALAALRDLGVVVPDTEMEDLRAALAPMARFRQGLDTAFPWPGHFAAALPDDAIVCRCECITAGELRNVARDKGAPELNRAKAFSRLGMGRCQGRMCGAAGAEILADALAVPLPEVGRLRGQGPVKPLPLATEIAP